MLAIIGHRNHLKYTGDVCGFLCQHYAIFSKGFEHPQVLVSEGSPGLIPKKYKASSCCMLLVPSQNVL